VTVVLLVTPPARPEGGVMRGVSGAGLRLVDHGGAPQRTRHGALEDPQDVHGGQDDAGRADHRHRRIALERADQHQELGDERVRAGQRQGRHGGHQEHAAEHRGDLPHPAVVGDVPRPAAGDQHADHQEQQAGGDAVVEHVQHRAGQRL
jgi:hypothetical protein